MLNSDQRLLVLIPTRNGSVERETAAALRNNIGQIEHQVITCSEGGVDDARNSLAATALKRADGRSCWVLWLDADIWFPEGSIDIMLATLRNCPDIQLLAGFYGLRVPFSVPLARRIPRGKKYDTIAPVEGVDFLPGDVVPVMGVGFGFVMHHIDLLRKLGANPFTMNSMDFAEDEAFTRRVRAIDGRIALHSGILIAHCDDGAAFIPGQRPGKIINNRFVITPDARSNDGICREYIGNPGLIRSYGKKVDERFSKVFKNLAIQARAG